MQDRRFGRFGWFDSIGPLWFLQERWSAGPRWRPTWARFFASPRGVALQAHTKKGGHAVAGCFIERFLWEDLSYGQKEDVVMGWIKQVRRPDGGQGVQPSAADNVWMSDFPALHEYLVVAAHADGTARRTSTITLFAEH